MKIAFISGSTVGTKTKTAIEKAAAMMAEKFPEHTLTVIDLATKQMVFSDGRNYFEYDGDTREVATTLMEADAIVVGTPVFQASIPGALKNVFDLLPVDAFRDKTVSMIVTAGSAKHFLIAENQLKPILSYMKATIVPTYVFIEESDFLRREIINDDIHFRLDRLIEDTVYTAEASAMIRDKQAAQYDF